MCIVIVVIGYYVRGCGDSGLRLIAITMEKASR